MKTDVLTTAYFTKAQLRIKALFFYKHHGAYSDVVYEAQKVVELLLLATLRSIVAKPRQDDIYEALENNRTLLTPLLDNRLDKIMEISKRLRKEKELSFYGADDFIPTEKYDLEDADVAITDAGFVLKTIQTALKNA